MWASGKRRPCAEVDFLVRVRDFSRTFTGIIRQGARVQLCSWTSAVLSHHLLRSASRVPSCLSVTLSPCLAHSTAAFHLREQTIAALRVYLLTQTM